MRNGKSSAAAGIPYSRTNGEVRLQDIVHTGIEIQIDYRRTQEGVVVGSK